MKVESRNIYPDIADTVLEKIEIPIIDREFRDEYVRPDTIRMYVTPQQNEESDEEFKRESERTRLKQKYEHRRIDRVTRKSKNSMGQVKYTVVWTDSNTEEVNKTKKNLIVEYRDS
jgi:hypothetical protein